MTVSDRTPSTITPARKPPPHQLEHPTVRHPLGHQRQQAGHGRSTRRSHGCRPRTTNWRPRGNATRIASIAVGGRPLRAGTRNCTGKKSASKIGSRTSLAACCTTRSRTVGIPNGRIRPSGLGISTRRTGAGRYLPARRSRGHLTQHAINAVSSTAPASLDRHRPRHDWLAPAPTPPTGRHPCRSGHTGRGNDDPKTAWPQPIACDSASCRTFTSGIDARSGSLGRAVPAMPLRCTRFPEHDRSRGPSLPPRLLHGDPQYYDPVGLPLRSVRLHHRLIPTVFADEAAQTGLSCSERNRAHVPLPVPRRDPTADPGTPTRRTWPSP